MKDEQKVLVAIGGGQFPGDPTTVILGMTPEGWDYAKDGKTHTFDLRKAGLPVQIVLFGGANHDEIVKAMAAGAKAGGADFHDARKKGPLPNIGIDEPTKQ